MDTSTPKFQPLIIDGHQVGWQMLAGQLPYDCGRNEQYRTRPHVGGLKNHRFAFHKSLMILPCLLLKICETSPWCPMKSGIFHHVLPLKKPSRNPGAPDPTPPRRPCRCPLRGVQLWLLPELSRHENQPCYENHHGNHQDWLVRNRIIRKNHWLIETKGDSM